MTHERLSRDAWQRELAEAFGDPQQLLAFLEMEQGDFPGEGLERAFPFRVTRSFAARMRKGDPKDPLLAQVLPSQEELLPVAGFSRDPVGDLASMAAPGLLHKYRGRALLLMTGACAIGCRYCFRRNFPYAESRLGRQAEREMLEYLQEQTSVEEVILSGGDPLMLSDRRLSELSRALAAIPHVRTLRVHSRLPIVLPSRVTEGLVESLTSTRLSAVMVVHANHPNEIDGEVSDALRRLCRSGTTVLNQSVLLKGVNDDASVLAELSRALFTASALPYYLHLLDRAHGTAHFLVPDERALAIHDALRRLLPGYLVPRMVREDAGKPYKSLV